MREIDIFKARGAFRRWGKSGGEKYYLEGEIQKFVAQIDANNYAKFVKHTDSLPHK